MSATTWLAIALASALIASLLVIRSLLRGQRWLRAYAKAHGINEMLTAIDSADEREGRAMVQRMCDAARHDHAPLDDLAWGRADARDGAQVAARQRAASFRRPNTGSQQPPVPPAPPSTVKVIPASPDTRTVRQVEHPGVDCAVAHPGVPHVSLRPIKGPGSRAPHDHGPLRH